MTHDELLAKIGEVHKSCSAGGSDKDVPKSYNWPCYNLHSMAKTLRAVVELHKPEPFSLVPSGFICAGCDNRCGCYEGDILSYNDWFTCPTIKAIEKELG